MTFPSILVFAFTAMVYYCNSLQVNEEADWRIDAMKKAEALLSTDYCPDHCIANVLTHYAAIEFILTCFEEFRNLSKKAKKTFIRDKLRCCMQLRTPKHKNFKYNWTVGVIPNKVRFNCLT